ncbi:MAG: DUF4105 domain-containing protein [Bdellovibrionales bacterium]
MGFLMRCFVILFLFLITPRSYSQDSHQSLENWKIEILVTAPSTNSIESIFGHSALLVIPPGKSIEDGTVWNFQPDISKADTNTPFQTILGLTNGQFPFLILQEPALIFFSRQLIYELRSIQRIIVPTTPLQSGNLIKILKQVEANPRLLKKYSFRTENCLTAILRILRLSGLPINLNQLITIAKNLPLEPNHLPQIFRQLLISPIPPQTALNLFAQLKILEKKYNLKLQSQNVNGKYLSWDSREKYIFKSLKKHELALAAHSLAIFDDQRLPYLQELIKNSNSSDHQSLVNLNNFPDIFYRTCTDFKCAKKLVESAKEVLGKQDFLKLKSTVIQEYRRSSRLFVPEINIMQSPQGVSWKLILDYLFEDHKLSLLQKK